MELTKLELENLRHMIGQHGNINEKLNFYAKQTTDQEVKQLFERSAQDALNTKNKLLAILG